MKTPTRLSTCLKRYCNYSPIANTVSVLRFFFFEILEIITEHWEYLVFHVCLLYKLLRIMYALSLNITHLRISFEKLVVIITRAVLWQVMCVSEMDRPLWVQNSVLVC